LILNNDDHLIGIGFVRHIFSVQSEYCHLAHMLIKGTAGRLQARSDRHNAELQPVR
jgi:hypothetical protein